MAINYLVPQGGTTAYGGYVEFVSETTGSFLYITADTGVNNLSGFYNISTTFRPVVLDDAGVTAASTKSLGNMTVKVLDSNDTVVTTGTLSVANLQSSSSTDLNIPGTWRKIVLYYDDLTIVMPAGGYLRIGKGARSFAREQLTVTSTHSNTTSIGGSQSGWGNWGLIGNDYLVCPRYNNNDNNAAPAIWRLSTNTVTLYTGTVEGNSTSFPPSTGNFPIASANSKVYWGGGIYTSGTTGASTTVQTVWRSIDSTGTIASLTAIPDNFTDNCSAAVYQNNVYLLGGYNVNLSTWGNVAIRKFDTTSNTWSSVGSAPGYGFIAHQYWISGTRLYIVQERYSSSTGTFQSNNLVYFDFNGNTWNDVFTFTSEYGTNGTTSSFPSTTGSTYPWETLFLGQCPMISGKPVNFLCIDSNPIVGGVTYSGFHTTLGVGVLQPTTEVEFMSAKPATLVWSNSYQFGGVANVNYYQNIDTTDLLGFQNATNIRYANRADFTYTKPSYLT